MMYAPIAHPEEDAFQVPAEMDWDRLRKMMDAKRNQNAAQVAGEKRFPTEYGTKLSNPKDAVGVAKWRQMMTIPMRVLWEVGVGMLEGAMKYGRHNYRPAGVRASVYTDAAMGHITQWIEGEDTDADSGLSHITKAICSLVVLRDGMIEGNFVDDRPPHHAGLDAHRQELQEIVDQLFARYPNPCSPFTDMEHGQAKSRGAARAQTRNAGP